MVGCIVKKIAPREMGRKVARAIKKNHPFIVDIMKNEALRENEVESVRKWNAAEFYDVLMPFETMAQLPVLSGVVKLSLYNVHVSMGSIGQYFPKLQHLYISFTSIALLPNFEHLKTLLSLHLKQISGMEYVFDTIATLPMLQELTLKHMPSLMAIPMADRSWFPSLQRLKVSACHAMISYCEHLYLIPSLQTLIIYGAKYHEQRLKDFDVFRFPPTLRTVKLRYLDIPYDPSSEHNCFPLGLYDLQSLVHLSMKQCFIFEIPEVLMPVWHSLQTFIATKCRLNRIPLSIKGMQFLKVFDVSHNDIIRFPVFLQCPQLFTINVSHNYISEINVELFELPKLAIFFAVGNYLKWLPFPLEEYKIHLSRFLTFDVSKNLFAPDVLDYINNIITYRKHPNVLRTLLPPVLASRAPRAAKREMEMEDDDDDEITQSIKMMRFKNRLLQA